MKNHLCSTASLIGEGKKAYGRVCYFVLLNRYWGIVTVPGIHSKRVKGNAPTIRDRRCPFFLFNQIHTASAPSTSGTHTDGGAVMLRPGSAEERHYWRPSRSFFTNVDLLLSVCVALRVEFLLKTDSGYPRDAEVTLFTLATPEHSLRFNTHWSAPPVSALARSGGPRKMSQSPVSRNSNIERCMDRPRVWE